MKIPKTVNECTLISSETLSSSGVKRWIDQIEFVLPPLYMYDSKYKPLLTYFSGRFIDRTGTFGDIGFNQKIIDQLPTSVKTSVPSFDELCDQRALQLKSISDKKGLPLAVLWSGGMDSTVVAASLLKQNIPFTLIYNNHSIEENADFYQDVLKDNALVRPVFTSKPLDFLSQLGHQYIPITGECGAQMMGTISWEKFIPGSRTSALEIVGGQRASHLMSHPSPLYGIPEPYKSLLMPIIEKAPRSFKYNYDYMWWVTFALKWQVVQYRFTLFSGKIQPNLENYFLTADFADWALATDSSIKCPSFQWNNYKMPMREYIYNYYPNKNVYAMKKYASMPKSHPEIAQKAKKLANMGYAFDGEYFIEDF
jgi:hypothetical protein